MDDRNVQRLEKLLHEKILLYNDLLHCLNEERESLINVDLDRLWQISHEKEELCKELEKTKGSIWGAIDPLVDAQDMTLSQMMEKIPRTKRALFQKLYLRLIKLKTDIDLIRRENMAFINDSLEFLDDIISIISGEPKRKIFYDDRCLLNSPETNIFIKREA
jgi:hypothetical protein